MIINFNEQELQEFPNFKGGEKSLNAKMFFDGMNRIICGELEPGASIGMHLNETNSEIIYILEGKGVVKVEGGEEAVEAGNCHYCPKGHSHSLVNNSDAVLKFLGVVPEQ